MLEALVPGRFTEQEEKKQLHLWAVVVSLNAGKALAAYDAVRHACNLQPYSVAIWNLFNQVVNKAGNQKKHYKFVLRLLLRHPDSVPCMILIGHHCQMSGSTKMALAEYIR